MPSKLVCLVAFAGREGRSLSLVFGRLFSLSNIRYR